MRGERPRGLRQIGYEWAFLFGAVRPATGQGFALVLPEVSTAATQAFLDGFAASLAADAHAVLVLDQAGWHGSRSLAVPPNITLVPLPPYAPELNPVGACLAVPARALPLPSRARWLRRHRRSLLRGVERAHAGAHPIAHRLPLDHKGHFIGAAV